MHRIDKAIVYYAIIATVQHGKLGKTAVNIWSHSCLAFQLFIENRMKQKITETCLVNMLICSKAHAIFQYHKNELTHDKINIIYSLTIVHKNNHHIVYLH